MVGLPWWLRLGRFLEKEMATHLTFSGEFHEQEEPGRLIKGSITQFMTE